MTVYEELKARGLVAQMTHEDKIKDILENQKATFYIGFDPTADSLHVGHFLQLMVMAHMQRAGHRPIALIGGGTAMVGDPSGRTDMRKMLTKEEIEYNGSKFVKQMSGIVDFSEGNAIMLNNADWLLGLNYVNFLRDVGVHFSVNKMLTAECFKSRLEKGLSFIEFNYMLMQSYDFLKLTEDYGCSLELGGDDQWANILGGIELVRRVHSKEVYGMTFTLLTTSEGKKMGKTAGGAVWLDRDKTSPYDFYQYWRNVEDADVIKCLKMLTFLPLEEIAQYEKLQGSELNRAKEILAYEVTALVHGKEDATVAQDAARALFSGSRNDNVPTVTVNESLFENGKAGIIDILSASGIAPSRSEARRLVQQGGVLVDDKKVESFDVLFTAEDINDKMVKKGKKNFYKIVIEKV